METPPDDRSLFAVAMGWVSRITTVAAEMALPALLGHWADREFGTKIVFLALGGIAGFALGMWHLLKLAALPPTVIQRRGGRRETDEDSSESRHL